jgi:hypothetical protein
MELIVKKKRSTAAAAEAPAAGQHDKISSHRRWSHTKELAAAARSGPRFVPLLFLLLAGYENLTAPNAIMQS